MRYRDIEDIEHVFRTLNVSRLVRLFSWRESIELGRIFTGRRFRREHEAIIAAKQVIVGDDGPLRVKKSVVAMHIDWSRFNELQIIDGGINEALDAINRVHDRVASICNLQILLSDEDVADFVTRFVDVDGPGGTLAFVPQPRVGNDIQACEGCGDVFFDVAKRCFIADFANIYQHELGHTFGMGHGPSDSVMGTTYSIGSPERDLDDWTITEYVKRYGVTR